MERLDKVISLQTSFSRKEIRELIKNRKVIVNNVVALKPDLKVDTLKDIIKINNLEMSIKDKIYLILNKPKGYISATEDRNMKTILDLVPEKFSFRNLFPVGRLDKDTTGLIVITDDGEFAHNILSPKKHIEKTYYVKIDKNINEEMIEKFKKGVNLKDGICKPAVLEKISDYEAYVTITEGRYHQIKRMFGCFNSKVLELERVKIGNFVLPDDLKFGECRELSIEEMDQIMCIK